MAIIKKDVPASYHWYTKEGRPLHRVPTADGKGEKPTTLADARKLGLYPSVSTILGILDKPGLNKWKHKQIALQSMTLKRSRNESDDYFAARIIEAALQQVDDAADKGTAVHHDLQNFFLRPNEEHKFEHPDLVIPTRDWFAHKGFVVEAPETTFVNHEEGYGGTIDAPARFDQGRRIAIVDFKTRKTEPGEPVDYWPNQPTQIAAYAAAYWGASFLQYCWGVNIYISSTEPGRVDTATYKPEQLIEEFEAFKHLAAIWRHYNQYDPRAHGTDKPRVYPQPIIRPWSGPGGVLIVTAPPAPKEQTAPVNQGAHDTKPAVEDARLTLALSSTTEIKTECDGIGFLDIKTSFDLDMKGKFKSDYAYWVMDYRDGTTPRVQIGLRNDAAMREIGWQQVCKACPKDISVMESMEAKPIAQKGELPLKGTLTRTQAVKAAKEVLEQPRQSKAKEPVGKRNAPICDWGKWRGTALDKIDADYLDWLRDQTSILKSRPLVRKWLEENEANIDRKLKRMGKI